jgi:hypothetical protein
VIQEDHGDLFQGEQIGCLKTRVSGEDVSVFVSQNGRSEPESLDASGECPYLCVGVFSSVLR